MITDAFLLQLSLTFLVGSTWIYLTAQAGAHFGSTIGGFIGGLPSTVLLSFFFMGLTQSPELASNATTVFPLAIGISGLFLVAFAWLVRRGFLLALSVSVGIWFLLSLLAALCHPTVFAVNLAIYALILCLAYRALQKHLSVTSIPRSRADHATGHLAIRSLFGGLAIVSTVLAAKLGGPVVGGIGAAFPAMSIATLAIAHTAHGAEFSRAMTKPLLVTGMITVAAYSVAVRYLYPSTGLYRGTLVAVFIAAVSAYVTYRCVLPGLMGEPSSGGGRHVR